jgi:chromosomal replication initiation ATPase DnaA
MFLPALQAHSPAELQPTAPFAPLRRRSAATLRSTRREEETIALCEGMIDVAAALFQVSSKDMRRAGRTGQGVSRVRQIAMYVTHITLGLTMAEVGKGFQRDRTTVLHACHLVEDMRDDAEFDAIVGTLERVAAAAFGGRGEGR